MKKKIVVTLVASLCLFMLCACGKGKETPESESSHSETYEEMKTEVETESFETEESSEEVGGFRLVEPSDEIVNSTIEQNIVQVYDVVAKLNGTYTVGDFYKAISDSTGYEISFDGNLSEVSLIEPIILYVGNVTVQYVTVCDNDNEAICELTIVNNSEDYRKLFDCPIVAITPKEGKHALNFFYAGNLCAGSFERNLTKAAKELPEYAERLSQYPTLNYDEISTYLANQGYPGVECSGNVYEILGLSGESSFEFQGKVYYPAKKILLEVDLTTATCSAVYCTVKYEPGEEMVDYIRTLEELPDERVRELEAYIQNNIINGVSGSPKLIGYGYMDDGWDSGVIMVYKTDSSRYVAVNTCAYRRYDGDISIEPKKITSENIYTSLGELSMYELYGEPVKKYSIPSE